MPSTLNLAGLAIGALLGWVIGPGLVLALGALLPASWVALWILPPVAIPPLLAIGLWLLFHVLTYALAVVATPVPVLTTPPQLVGFPATPGPVVGGPGEAIARGSLVGMNTAVCYLVLMSLSVRAPFANVLVPLAPLALPVALIQFLALFPSVSQRPNYQIALAWMAFVTPTTWLMTLIGAVFLVVNAAAWVLGAQFQVFPNWPGASLVQHGGITHLFPAPYDLGNFVLAHPDIGRDSPRIIPAGLLYPGGMLRETVDGVVPHEVGHNLCNAVFGFPFSLVGLVDQILLARPVTTYSELCVEGRARSSTRAWNDLFASANPLVSPINAVPIASGRISAAVSVDPFEAVGLRGETASFDAQPGPGAGTPSSDPDSRPRPLGFLWWITHAEDGEELGPVEPNAALTSFAPTRGGRHIVRLVATDGIDGGVGFFLLRVVAAEPGGPYTAAAGDAVPLDGSTSTGGDLVLGFQWTLATADPSVTIADAASETPELTAASAGTYTVVLTVTVQGMDEDGDPFTVADSRTTIVEIT